jgi:hypothetical protein
MEIAGGTLGRLFVNMAVWDKMSIFRAIVLCMIVPSAVSLYGLVVRGWVIERQEFCIYSLLKPKTYSSCEYLIFQL